MLRAIQQNVAWRAILPAGIIAGTVFLATNLIFTPLILQIDASIVLRYFASLLMGQGVLTDGGAVVWIVGLLVHYALSIFFTFVIAIVVHRWGLAVGIVGGAILGLAFYGINLYALTVVFTWFFAINSVLFLISHVLFGAVAGGVYEMLDHYDEPLMAKGMPNDTYR